jgi:hypothetical protein
MTLPPYLDEKMRRAAQLNEQSKLHARRAHDLAIESERLMKELMGELDQFDSVAEVSERRSASR